MDQEWKNQNQTPPSSGDQPLPPPTPATVITPVSSPAPAAEPGNVPGPAPSPAAASPAPLNQPAQTVMPAPAVPDTLAGQNIYDQYTPGVGSSSKKKIVVSILVLAILAVSGGTYALLGQKQSGKVDNQTPAADNAANQAQSKSQLSVEEKKPAVPVDWKTVDSKLGFTVKVPADWSGGNSVPTDSEFGIYKSKSITIGAPAETSGDSILPYTKFVSMGLESITTSKSEADFEKAMTDVDTVANTLGIDKSQVKINVSKVNISGKQWTQADSEIPNQFSKTLYLWVNDHAIYLTVASQSKDQLDKLANDYLFPVAASLEVK